MNLKAIGISIVLLFLYIVIVSYFIKHNSFEQEKQCNPVTPIPTPIDKKQVKDIFDGNHLGCYDTSNTLLHSSRIRNYLSETVNKYRSGEIIKLDQHNSVVMRGSFDKQVKDLAVIFEKYLDEYYQLKIRGDYENNWHNSLQLARMEYVRCSRGLQFDGEGCKGTWQVYEKNKKDFVRAKEEIESYLKNKLELQKQIQAFLDTKPINKPVEKTNNLKEYNRELISIEQTILKGQTSDNYLKKEMQKHKEEIVKIQYILGDCQAIRLCNEISSTVKQFKIDITKQQLMNRIKNKKMIIESLKEVQRQSRKSCVLEISQDVKRNQEELMLLESQFTLFSSYEEQLCSQCSQDRLNELNQNLTMHRASVNQIVVQLGEIEKGLIVSRQRKMVLLGMIQQADQQLCNNDDDVLVPSLRIVGLTTLRQQLSECKKKIIESKYVLEELSRKQKKTVEELQRYFEKVQAVHLCLGRKEYYEKLLQKAPKAAEGKIAHVSQHKQSMLKQLTDFQL